MVGMDTSRHHAFRIPQFLLAHPSIMYQEARNDSFSNIFAYPLEKRCGICPKLTIKTPPFSRLSIVEFKQVNTGWVRTTWIIP